MSEKKSADQLAADEYFVLKMKHMSPDEIKYYKQNPDKSFTVQAYLDGRASMRDEVKALKELAWDLDDYVIHSRRCEPFIKCTCGLSEIKARLPEFLSHEIKPFAKKDEA